MDRRQTHCRWNGSSHLGLHDVGVDFSHAIDSMGTHNAEMGHVDPFASFLFYQRHPSQAVNIIRKQGRNFLAKGRESCTGHSGLKQSQDNVVHFPSKLSDGVNINFTPAERGQLALGTCHSSILVFSKRCLSQSPTHTWILLMCQSTSERCLGLKLGKRLTRKPPHISRPHSYEMLKVTYI